MTYTEAKRAARLAISFTSTSRRSIAHWNSLDDALNELSRADFERILMSARAGNTEADCALVYMCE